MITDKVFVSLLMAVGFPLLFLAVMIYVLDKSKFIGRFDVCLLLDKFK